MRWGERRGGMVGFDVCFTWNCVDFGVGPGNMQIRNDLLNTNVNFNMFWHTLWARPWPIWAHTGPHWPNWVCIDPYGRIWAHMGPYEFVFLDISDKILPFFLTVPL